ncbi:PAS/PAC sensor signal transduction histidine kinase [Bacillus oleivorans]|uniref:histidine kinase n=1 Tax=Bacillus oleivorans TaxID=1448271 RepID=A0A285CV42_9BACI|nr:ATP-binding protein [Bacillus oleivorans]SNX71441.1 PAS/PAC sensor signal transduction histidine kinase [Bacillus oleivorans]
MTRFRSRLLFAFISLITFVFLALGLILGQLFNRYYLDSFYNKIEMETKFIAELLFEQNKLGEPYTVIERIGEETESRITVLNGNGKILYDSDEETAPLVRHSEILEEIILESRTDNNGTVEVAGGYNVFYYWEKTNLSNGQDQIIVLSTQIDNLNQVNNQMWWVLIISFGLSLTLIILLFTKITNRFTKPIEAATSTAIELAKGNYRVRTYEDGFDEIGSLNTSINILARNLQETIETNQMQQERLSTLIENMGSGLVLIDEKGKISLVNKVYRKWFHVDPSQFLYKHYYEVMSSDELHRQIEDIFMLENPISRQIQIHHSLERKHYEVLGAPIVGSDHEWKGIVLVFHDITELKKLEQMRKDFVANVSHELKTPITSIKGFSETLLDGAMNDKATLENFLKIIQKESDRLQSLVQDLLELSRIEQADFTLNMQTVHIRELVDDAIAILQPKAESRDIQLQSDIKVEQNRIMADPFRIKQIIINLVNNALTYTQAKGLVKVEVYEKDKWIILQVKDTGIGIEKNEITRIFERFYRVDKARSRNSGGTGLGLAIVKHLVEAHKGKIEVESKVGEGTAFTIYLPKS